MRQATAPDVATGLNNLAGLLRARNHLSEAEPMYRRGLVILARFTQMTGHRHPNLDTLLSNYAGALRGLGRIEAEIDLAPNPSWKMSQNPHNDPAVSVIMPVRNGAEWLAEAVASVRAQDFGDFEFLIVDDGSDDGTAALLSTFAAADGRICLLRQAPQGIVAALNTAIAAARAPYLARLDADDRARPDRLGKQFAFLQSHPEIGLVGTFAERIDAVGNVVGRLTPPTDPARLARMLERTNPFIHSSVMMRTPLVRRVGGYRPAFRAAEDYDLWQRLAEAGGIANLADYLTQYRWHHSNLSRRDAVRQSFSVRLAQRSAAGRRSGAGDPAGILAAPPDWWADDAETSFFADDVGLYRLLDAGAAEGSRHIQAVRNRLFSLNHVERRLAQMRLRAMLREMGAPIGTRHLWIAMLIAALHPGRALSFAWGRDSPSPAGGGSDCRRQPGVG